MLDLIHVRSFTEVASRGTVAAAATTLGYTPPAVSQHLAKLEVEVGRTLFDRAGGRLTLTSAGEALLPVAYELLDLADRARVVAGQPSSRPHFTIAGFASAISTIVTPRIAELHAAMDIDVIEAEDAEAMRDLSSGAVDLVLVQEYGDELRQRDPRFSYAPLLRDELVLVLPGDRSAATRIADLANSPWLLNGSSTLCSDAATRLLASRGISPVIRGAIGDNSALLELVAAGHGATIVPSSVVRQHPDVVVAHEQLGVFRTIFGVARSSLLSELEPLLATLAAAHQPSGRHRGLDSVR